MVESTSAPDKNTMPLEDLRTQIENLANAGEQQTQQPPIVAQAETAPAQVGQATVVSEIKAVNPAEQLGSDGKPQVEAKPASEGAFTELQKKSGFKSPDDLAKSYQELQRTLTKKSQEQVTVPKQEIPKQVEQTHQPEEYIKTPQDIYFEKRIREVGTVAALAELNSVFNKPVMEKVKDDEFSKVLHKFANSPETADFNLPEIQAEIHKLITERPQQFADQDGRVYPEALSDLYWIAKGRVGTVRPGIQANTVTQKFVPVEGNNKPNHVQVEGDPKTMPLEQLAALISSKGQG